MASSRLYCAFFLLLIAFSSFSSSSSSADKVSLALYYESLCPFCANFIVNYLSKTFDNGITDIVDLHLVPWGNAKILSNATFDCQHGEDECLLNTVEACATNLLPELNKHFPFINCVETMVLDGKERGWETCFEKPGLDKNTLSSCYNGELGNKLEKKYAAETESLKPSHKFVPRVVVGGRPLEEDYENFVSYVCKAYNDIREALHRVFVAPHQPTLTLCKNLQLAQVSRRQGCMTYK